MARLELASSKIPTELMDRLKRFTESTGVNQSAAIRKAIEQFLDIAESTGLTRLTNSEDNFQSTELGARVDAVDDRLTGIEKRLEALEEGRSSASPPEPIAAIVTTTEPKAKKSPPPPDSKPLADGGQWLTTTEAWKLAQKRGCDRNYSSFSKHAKAHPDKLDVWGLRFLGSNKPGDQRTASFQDLLWD
jgi:predicted DNA-binding protein